MHAVVIDSDVNYSAGSEGTCKFSSNSHPQSNIHDTVL